MTPADTLAARADVCAIACAEAFRGDGRIFASPMGTMPRLGALVAWASFEPDLVISDGNADLLAGPVPLGTEAGAPREGRMPFREVFHTLARGRRHVMMGASQIDRYGNQNISAIGDWSAPTVQLLGARGAPGNTVNHATSYFVGGHNRRVFVEAVDFASGVGSDRASGAAEANRFRELRRIVTDLCVLDGGGPDGSIRLISVHPGVTVEEVVAATGFTLDIPQAVPSTRTPTEREQELINWLDPTGLRNQEVPA